MSAFASQDCSDELKELSDFSLNVENRNLERNDAKTLRAAALGLFWEYKSERDCANLDIGIKALDATASKLDQ